MTWEFVKVFHFLEDLVRILNIGRHKLKERYHFKIEPYCKAFDKTTTTRTNDCMGTHGIFVDLHGDVELFHTVVKVVETFKVGLFSLG
jgi:hypothetical protein